MLHSERHLPVIVVGAGPAGLAVSHGLVGRSVDHAVLERGRVGESWRRYYDDLVLHTGRHLSSLPGRAIPASAGMFVARARFVAYLEDYARALGLPIRELVEVGAARRVDGGWTLETETGPLTCEVLIVTTGIAAAPWTPDIPGRDRFQGSVRHSIDYHRPTGTTGRRVLVVGAGNSGGEIAAELGRAGADVTIAIRSGVVVVPRDIAGIPTQYIGYVARHLPRAIVEPVVRLTVRRRARRLPASLPRSDASPLDEVPLIGMHLPDAIRDGLVRVRPALVGFTEHGARFADGAEAPFDEVILATGFRAAIGFLGDAATPDARGFARRTDRITGADAPRLLFAGQEYDATGGLANIRRDAPDAAARAAGWLGSDDR